MPLSTNIYKALPVYRISKLHPTGSKTAHIIHMEESINNYLHIHYLLHDITKLIWLAGFTVIDYCYTIKLL